MSIMQIDPALQTNADNYKLLTNLVVPRPIAWVTSQSETGIVNLAPFSFFNAVGSDPLYLIVRVGRRDTGEFVVNLVTEDLFDAMNISAADFPPDQSELTAAGLHATPSLRVKPPRLAESKASLECKLYKAEPLGPNTLFIGEVVMFHVADELVGERFHINNFAPLGRLGSPSAYCRTTDRFEIPRMTYAQWRNGQASEPAPHRVTRAGEEQKPL
jgi:flavin reductase (DIM6/NTAB) family NADH-FMN oxidoreductase RutF